MENAFSLACDIANKITEEKFFSYYAEKHNYNMGEDLMRIKERKKKLWGQIFGDKFSSDSDVPKDIKELHKTVFTATYEVLSKFPKKDDTDSEMERLRDQFERA